MENKARKNLLVRSVSAALLIPVVVYVIMSGLEIFYASIGLISVLMGMEWYGMLRTLRPRVVWNLVALVYILSFIISLSFIRNQEAGQSLLIWILVTTWMADTGAFIFGKVIGGPKLAPKISPSKTWAGVVGAVVFSWLSGIIFGYVFITILLGVLSLIGDLFESWIKRKAGVKDSGKTIPGHGGILDRVDSLVVSAAGLAVILVVFKIKFLDIFKIVSTLS
jgi:phosphatidate cytidylyltransferase